MTLELTRLLNEIVCEKSELAVVVEQFEKAELELHQAEIYIDKCLKALDRPASKRALYGKISNQLMSLRKARNTRKKESLETLSAIYEYEKKAAAYFSIGERFDALNTALFKKIDEYEELYYSTYPEKKGA